MLGTLAGMVGAGMAASAGASAGSTETAWTLLTMLCGIFIPTCIGTVVADRQKNKELQGRQLTRLHELTRIANKYNSATDMLVSSYKSEKRMLGLFDSLRKEQLRSRYEGLYYRNKAEFEAECQAYSQSHQMETPEVSRFKKIWKYIIGVGMILQLMACSYTFGIMMDDGTETAVETTAAPTSQESIGWNAENIPMPHLTDGSRYVSNPDKVVSANTEQLLNRMLKRMDDSLKIESAMVIVNHVENEDVFRLAQDLFDKYKIGKDDRGMVIVLAYQDHQVRTHTGRALEADLTDIECSRLQQTYAVPFMKSEQPDSGMLYLTEAIYNLLQKKELPVTYSQRKEQQAEEASCIFVIYLMLFGGWAALITYLNRRYNGISGRSLLHANPFAKAPVVVVGGNGSGGGFGGGGFSGGGFSGGSSGGGGATSRW